MNSPGFYAVDDFDAALQLGTTYLAYGLRIVDRSNMVRAFTNLRRPQSLPTLTIPISPGRSVSVPATRYEAKSALRVTNLQKSDDPTQTDNMEATLAFSSVLPEAFVRAGGLDNCPFHFLVFDWKTPVGNNGNARAILQLRGKTGERTIRGQDVTWKLRSLSHFLRGEVLEQTSRDSRARWGDPELAGVNLDADLSTDGFHFRLFDYVDEVDPDFPRSRFRVNAASIYPDDRFVDGTVDILVQVPGCSPFEASFSILQFEVGSGWFSLASDAPFDFQVGQSITCTVRAPRTMQEWLLYLPSGRYAACEPGIPTVESANRIKPS